MPLGVTGPSVGALTPLAPATAVVGVASAQAVAKNPARTSLRIVNTSTTARVSLGLGQAAVLDSGLTLMPGGTWNMDSMDYTIESIFAIGSAAATLSVQQFQ